MAQVWTTPQPAAIVASLWHLSRPRGALFVASLPVLGLLWGHWDRALPLRNVGLELLVVAVAWLLLNAGTLWLNAALDRDEGEVLFGSPAALPPGLPTYGYGALLLSVLLASSVGPWPGLCAAGCAALAVLYSHPRTAWKGHALGGPLVNAVGYGVLSPLAGWSLAGVTPNARSLGTLCLMVVLVMAAYFAGQAFQAGEDGRRGYRTLVVTHGPRAALSITRGLLWAAFGGVAVLSLAGWYPGECLLALVPFWFADRRLVAWRARADQGTLLDASLLFRRLVLAGLCLVAASSVAYTRDRVAGRPVAGLGTAAGHPADRVWGDLHGTHAPGDALVER